MKGLRFFVVPILVLGLLPAVSAWELILDGQGYGRRWFDNQMPVRYVLNTSIDEPSVPGSAEFDEIRAGLPEWSYATTGLSVASPGSTGKVGTSYDQQNVVSVQDTTGEISGNTLAATFIYLNGSQQTTVNGQAFKNMTDCDIIFGDGFNFGTSEEANAPGCVDDISIQAVATHEFGHLLGLDHSSNGASTMFFAIGACSTSKESINADDIAGITFIYPGASSLTADFEGNPTSGPVPLDVQFTDLSSGNPTSWYWDFGDTTTSSLSDPMHTYSAPGTYTVSLRVSAGGSSDTKTRVDYITVTQPPSADFTAAPRIGPPPLKVFFNNKTTGPVTSYLWDFGDGATSAAANPDHTYVTPGSYTVSLTATGPGGSDTKTRVDYITVVLPPVADFVGSPTEGLAPLDVAFTNLTSGQASSYLWSFGDGATSTAVSPQHTYASLGTFDVTLEATGPGGTDTETKIAYISTHEVLPDFVGTPRIGQPPLSVQFQDLSTGNVQSMQWDFGDGATSTASNPSHDYAALGRYTVSLTVTGPTTSETETRNDYILVSQAMPANIITGPGRDPAAPPQALAFDALADPNPATNITAYSVLRYGLNVGGGDIDGTSPAEIITGPGPGDVFGPQARAFRVDSTAVAKVNFYAYGTLKFGVAAIGAELDADGISEILTAAGHGAVFGPHVRGWNYDGATLSTIARINFFSYGTLKYGVNVGAGPIEGSPADDILTMPGPGPSFGPQLRGFRYAPPLAAIQKVNFFAFPEIEFGGRVATSELDADGFAELLAGRGPGPALTTEVAAFDYDLTSVAGAPGGTLEVLAGALYGIEPQGGDLDGDTVGELLLSRGADPAGDARALALDYDGAALTPIPSLDFVPYGTTYGMHTAVADLGF